MNLNKSCIEIDLAEVMDLEKLRWTLTRVVLKYSKQFNFQFFLSRMNLNKSCIEIDNLEQAKRFCDRWTLTRVVLKYNQGKRNIFSWDGWTLTRVVLKL